MKQLSEVRWGIIGCGEVTEVKSGPGLQKANNSRLVAVMRRDGELAKDYAQRHQVESWYDDADKLIDDPQVNAIYIATPPAYHHEYTLKAAAAGKVVYVEKPMALNYGQCQAMIDACETAHVPLFVAYYRRALPRFLKVKELLDSGILGDIRFVTTTQYRQASSEQHYKQVAPWRVQPSLAGGGYFFDLASHTLDILDFLLGPIKQATGYASNQAGNYDAEDIVTGTYTFDSGILGTGTWCFSGYKHVDQNEIVGTNGKVAFSTFGDDPIILETETSKQSFDFKNPLHVQQPLIQSIVNELTGNGKSPSTSISAARTNWVMDELTKLYYQS
ncbi:Gfo/Idh/MocA family protein [Radiobacillus sp. PE A8.2]|uniref:Gfo/Idh/MocA family protein n=1 Tax=Radiobacillus sp. PE A8.2 TaxID=3380349 RepID=UPI0038902EA7